MNTPNFSAPQQAVLDAIAQGATKTAASQSVGIHRDTINHWEHTVAGFRDALHVAQASYREELATQLRRVSTKAIDRLEALLDDPTTPPTVLFRAIQFVLTRPSFPQKEWALPENLNPPAIQQMQQSMAIIEGDYLAARQHDAIRKMTAGNVGSAGPVGNVGPAENAGTVGSAGSVGSNGSVGNVGARATAHLDAAHFPPSRHVPMDYPVTDSPSTSEMSESSDPPRRPGVRNLTVRRQPARNAACPCGSGKKYKRCCGTTALPILGTARAA